MGSGPPPRRRKWRIGELAAATGLTVRTLHHYEQVGLLPAATRTEGGQRLYDARDVKRLYRIRALRELGLSLPEIRRTLDRRGSGLRDVLRSHLARVDAERARLDAVRERLAHLCAHVDEGLEADDLIATIEAMTRVFDHIDDRRTRRPESDAAVEARWRELGDALRACRDADADPASSRTQAVARRIRARIASFSEGDPTTLEALGRLRRSTTTFNHAGWDAALLAYLDQALAASVDTEQPDAE